MTVTTDWASLLNTVVMFLLFIYGVKRWSGPSQDIQIRGLKAEFAVLRGNHKRLERDFIDFQKTSSETQEEILREIRSLAATGVRNRPLEQRIEKLEDRMDDADQILSSLPCSVCQKPEDAESPS